MRHPALNDRTEPEVIIGLNRRTVFPHKKMGVQSYNAKLTVGFRYYADHKPTREEKIIHEKTVLMRLSPL